MTNPTWMTVVAVLAIAFVLVGSSLTAASKSTPAGKACAMKDGCPMMAGGGAMVEAKVVAVNNDGSLTVKVKPAAGAPDAVKQAFAKAKVGDTFNCGAGSQLCGQAGCKACCGDNCKACCGDKCADCTGCAKQASTTGCPMGGSAGSSTSKCPMH